MVKHARFKSWQWGVAISSVLWATSGCTSPLINASPQNKPIKVAQLARHKITDQGDLRIVYVQPRDANFNVIYAALQDSLEFSVPQESDGLIAQLNTKFALPRDITVSFQECGEANAFYDPEQVKIEMCYELLKQYTDILGEDNQSSEAYADEVIYSALFTFFHELGHAFVDQYQLPITGLEENVVDEFATMMLLELQDDDAVIAGIDQFDVDAEEEEQLQELPFWTSHGLGAQRFYTVSCIIYGSNPEKFANFVTSGDLPQERADLCPVDYQRRERSWKFLLAPYRK
ncbi:DUF4344 domain-containing metallopeptidase [Acaryochloris sp. CCMEE 5410]|uniref:DUF4344 domain-containing metallopeptidase n=1 Tax=Acaryochloris sp. CCMEE 5410 TaxID=310037 RepID=UPI00024846B5|nr:DUF4344 domain-containing metallopeptidase [Acaryochloris sp. CCMEE 5410]KAI9131308.1 DUF4344 domain-containing metallopeptidase [Acaryochloris sp. CCMEE 5410]